MTDDLTAADVAKLAEVTPATARAWADKGWLTVRRTASGIRLFSRTDVENWIRGRRTHRPPRGRSTTSPVKQSARDSR